jgi:hypothetical protein
MITISSEQAAFFTKNGFLELEGVFSPSECEGLLQSIHQTLQERLDSLRYRDLWRQSPPLKTALFSKKMKSLAFALSRRPSLRLAFDQWFGPDFSLKAAEKIEGLFSIQGLVLVAFLQLGEPPLPPKRGALGLSPFPRKQGNILFVKPSLLLDWPQTTLGLYCVGFCLPTSVYVQNPHDPAGVLLRKLNYGYGDQLQNETHPLL